jgi:hypothetical protein
MEAILCTTKRSAAALAVIGSTLDAGVVIKGFQEVVDLDRLFDFSDVGPEDRAARLSLGESCTAVQLQIDRDGVGGAGLMLLTFQGLHGAGGLSIGSEATDDIQIGS